MTGASQKPQVIRIASRQSDLARIQAYTVGEQFMQAYPGVKIAYQFRESLGDKNLNDPLWKIPEKGVFTRDFHQDLVNDLCDLVVHSWKDLAVEENNDTVIAATFEREDVRDVLFVKKSSFERIKLEKTISIYTSSPRRMYHFEKFAKIFLPFQIQHCTFESVRGNIQTRMKKMLEADSIDGILMAKAGLDRMLQASASEFQTTQNFFKQALEEVEFMILPVTTNPQAPAQGALAIEVKRSREDLIQLLNPLNHKKTFISVQREREILKSYGGGCHSKLGVSSFSNAQFELDLISGFINDQTVEREVFKTEQTQRFSSEEMFAPQSSDYFSLEYNKYHDLAELVQQIPSGNFAMLEVAKASYLTDLSELKNVLCWSSGLETWKKLAAQNIWVHGSQESFGSLIPRTQSIFGKKLSWFKLTHEAALDYPGYQSEEENLKSISLCKLVDLKPYEDLSPYRAFYWRSGSLFLKAVKEQPNIIHQAHFCGLGETYNIIQSYFAESHLYGSKNNLNLNSKICSFPSEKLWRNHVTKI
ncbi:MAG: hydroxymethylbilane synthase [Pseudobdellovibrionaceae bacterium]